MELLWRPPTDADYDVVISSLDEWWGGRRMSDMLPRLFFDHFADTSLVAVDEQADVAAFIVAFVSARDPSLGYVHFVGVDPTHRGQGLAAEAYRRTFTTLAERGCTRVKAVTSVANTDSQAFHRALGFAISDPVVDYDGPGEDRVVLERSLSTD
ncbi:MAG: GNAT family N-acetyltransferase [Actinomycetota bacterium]